MRFQISLVPQMKFVSVLFVVLSLSACGQLISNVKKDFAQDLSATILEFNDPDTIKKGVPTYLILISSMIKGDPENVDLLESAAQLYSAYASSFTDSEASKKNLAGKGFEYASRAICLKDSSFCDAEKISYFEFKNRLARIKPADINSLFIFVSSWAGIIEANASDWNAVAELPKVKTGIQRVIDVDETVSNGNAHLYMAVMESLLPPALGGKPELAKQHFDRAITLSNNTNLMAKVLYAEKYARMIFDRKLHDELLQQVIAADMGPSELTLVNALAKQKAAALLLGADDYF